MEGEREDGVGDDEEIQMVMMREMIPERKSRCFRLLFRQMPIQVLLFDMVLIITPLFY